MYVSRNPYFEALLKEGTNTSPIGAHTQGMSRLAFALLAGLERGQMDRNEREARERTATRLEAVKRACRGLSRRVRRAPTIRTRILGTAEHDMSYGAHCSRD